MTERRSPHKEMSYSQQIGVLIFVSCQYRHTRPQNILPCLDISLTYASHTASLSVRETALYWTRNQYLLKGFGSNLKHFWSQPASIKHDSHLSHLFLNHMAAKERNTLTELCKIFLETKGFYCPKPAVAVSATLTCIWGRVMAANF